jgi:hypothetical protein
MAATLSRQHITLYFTALLRAVAEARLNIFEGMIVLGRFFRLKGREQQEAGKVVTAASFELQTVGDWCGS